MLPHKELMLVTQQCIDWCKKTMQIPEDVQVNFKIRKNLSAWGRCSQETLNKYSIEICSDQDKRDFVATVAHEMIHVRQWYYDDYEGDGEDEAWANQYIFGDAFLEETCTTN